MEKQHLPANTAKQNTLSSASNYPKATAAKLVSALIFLPITVMAATPAPPATEPTVTATPNIHFSLSKTPGAELQLDAKQAALADIVKQIAEKTNVIIHYSVLPEAPVSATCIAGKVQQLMECLVGKQIGVMAHKGDSGKEEVWLLGSSVGGCPATTTTANAAPAAAVTGNTAKKPVDKQYSDDLLAGLKAAKTAEERKNALSYLTAGADINDPSIREALNEAMADKDPAIRRQAVSSMAELDTDNAADIISRALRDKNSSVRMAAIDSAGNNQELLEQAVNDSDKMVSSHAADKLGMLIRNQERLAQQQMQ